MNYSELNSAIQNYCQNTETSFVSNIPVFVKQAEDRIYRSVNLPVSRKVSTGTLTSSNQYLTYPTDMLVPLSLAVTDSSGDEQYLIFKDQNFIAQSYPDTADTAFPKHYAIYDSVKFILGQTPNSNYAYQLNYFYKPESIVTASTTWLGDNADSVLLYGSLIEAYTYMKGDPDIMGLYNSRYQEALGLLKVQAEGRMTVDEYRDGTIRVPRV